MQNFETRLKERTSAIKAKIAEAMQQAQQLREDIIELRNETAEFVKQELEDRKTRLAGKEV
jgi:hypothetical protein